MDVFTQLRIEKPERLLMGSAPVPVRCGRGLNIGNGRVIPEINFTLPSIEISESNWGKIRRQYQTIINDICERTIELQQEHLVVEFELLPPMTMNPAWGGEITGILTETLDRFNERYGLKSALRVTPIDLRDGNRPPRMRSGELLEKTLESFKSCAKNGADLLSVESTGGKEVHDDALMNGDLAGIAFALGVLAVSDVDFLWEHIINISDRYDCIPAGDTACGFANTAMVLADRKMIPKVLAAVVRAASVPRTLRAHLMGAPGPTKDCAYEGPYIKVITGVPISMEGKSASGAHLSSLGNIAAAACDLWSNESIQNVRLLSGSAPVASVEQLIYDCRLMNQAIASGIDSQHILQKWLVNSDAFIDPQAFMLHPDVVMTICRGFVKCKSPLEMTLFAMKETLNLLKEAHGSGDLKLTGNDLRWLDIFSDQVSVIPEDESDLLELIRKGICADKFLPEEYGF